MVPNDDLLLYTNPRSRGRIAHWMLEEVAAPYRIELVDFAKKEQKSAAFLAVNPMGKVPALVHRGVVVTEVAAICAYLADAFPTAKLAPPPESRERGPYLRWFFFGAGSFEWAVVDRILNRTTPEHAGRLGYGTLEETLEVIESALLRGPWLLGESFSAVDVFIGTHLSWAMSISKVVAPRPAFDAYLARIAERPAMKRTIEGNAALVAKLAG